MCLLSPEGPHVSSGQSHLEVSVKENVSKVRKALLEERGYNKSICLITDEHVSQ